MLTTHLNQSTLPKFVLLKDSCKYRALEFLVYILNTWKSKSQPVYYQYEYNRFIIKHLNDITIVDCVEVHKNNQFNDIPKQKNVIIIDSIAQIILKRGANETYQLLRKLLLNNNIHSVIGVLHTDLINEDDVVNSYLDNMANLNVVIESNKKLSYKYRKNSSKFITESNEYEFINGILKTSQCAQSSLKDKVTPENIAATLTSFKLDLNDHDKMLKQQLVLPYLPKAEPAGSGEIFYQFDEVDDWDEEDPDDDLDI